MRYSTKGTIKKTKSTIKYAHVMANYETVWSNVHAHCAHAARACTAILLKMFAIMPARRQYQSLSPRITVVHFYDQHETLSNCNCTIRPAIKSGCLISRAKLRFNKDY